MNNQQTARTRTAETIGQIKIGFDDLGTAAEGAASKAIELKPTIEDYKDLLPVKKERSHFGRGGKWVGGAI